MIFETMKLNSWWFGMPKYPASTFSWYLHITRTITNLFSRHDGLFFEMAWKRVGGYNVMKIIGLQQFYLLSLFPINDIVVCFGPSNKRPRDLIWYSKISTFTLIAMWTSCISAIETAMHISLVRIFN